MRSTMDPTHAYPPHGLPSLIAVYLRRFVVEGKYPRAAREALGRFLREAPIPTVRAHRFHHTFATRAIARDGREVGVPTSNGRRSPDMARRHAVTYLSAMWSGVAALSPRRTECSPVR